MARMKRVSEICAILEMIAGNFTAIESWYLQSNFLDLAAENHSQNILRYLLD